MTSRTRIRKKRSDTSINNSNKNSYRRKNVAISDAITSDTITTATNIDPACITDEVGIMKDVDGVSELF